MIQDRIAQIEATLASAGDLAPATRQELLALLAELKTEVAALQPEREAEARAIADRADQAITSFSRPEEDTPAALRDFRASVQAFEASHPQLVAVVDRIALTLSNMGI